VLRLADEYDLALVAASNNHGWGRTAAAWSVLHLPNWRDDSPAVLAQRIEQRVLTARRHAVHVVARRGISLAAPGGLSLALTAPDVLWDSVTTIDWRERLSWLFWIWAIPFARVAQRFRRRMRAARRSVTATSRRVADAPVVEAA
ncbi:MAG: hypothetical protein ABIT38_13540, partial [Gemmatimonadaceae bacterium]